MCRRLLRKYEKSLEGYLEKKENIIIISSCPDVFCKKVFLRNFAKLTGKHLCFPVNFAKFLRTPFLIEHLRWLLLIVEVTKCTVMKEKLILLLLRQSINKRKKPRKNSIRQLILLRKRFFRSQSLNTALSIIDLKAKRRFWTLYRE